MENRAARRERRRRILIAEDEAVTFLRIANIVEGLGCTAMGPADCPQDALRYIAHDEVDGAVLDVNLSGQPVYPVADRLALRGVPFVFLTAYGAHVIPPAHADRRVLQKPFSATDLARALADEFELESPPRAA